MSQQFTLLRVVTGAKMALGNCSNIHKKQENLKKKIKRGEVIKVRTRRFELPRSCEHSPLKAARLPISPRALL